MEIFIANLDTGIEEELLTKLFEVFGSVSSTIIVRDKITRASKGYGFVIMDSASNAQRAIDDLNGRELAGQKLIVKVSLPKDSITSRKKPYYPKDVNSQKDSSKSKMMHEDFEEEPEKSIKEFKEIIDETKFTKTTLEDGLIKISFKK